MSQTTDRPLGIADLFLDGDLDAPTIHELDCYFWCREIDDRTGKPHGAVHSSKPARVGPYFPTGQLGHVCIRIGPFMSEREANILRREHPEGDKPLGMQIEM